MANTPWPGTLSRGRRRACSGRHSSRQATCAQIHENRPILACGIIIPSTAQAGERAGRNVLGILVMNRETATPLLPARDGQVLTLTLNRPEARNALSENLIRALQLSLDEAV